MLVGRLQLFVLGDGVPQLPLHLPPLRLEVLLRQLSRVSGRLVSRDLRLQPSNVCLEGRNLLLRLLLLELVVVKSLLSLPETC